MTGGYIARKRVSSLCPQQRELLEDKEARMCVFVDVSLVFRDRGRKRVKHPGERETPIGCLLYAPQPPGRGLNL